LSTRIIKFKKLSLVTLWMVYALIAVGATVRATGAGMGCPDWPACFGSVVPPTSAAELPPDYQQQFSNYRKAKNEKFAKYLSYFGMEETAKKIATDESINQEAVFNPAKTWTEYFNRLAGAAVGAMMILLLARGFQVRLHNPLFFWLPLALLLITIFQGWFGSIVVSTNLTSWTVSVHLIFALLIVTLLVYLITHINKTENLPLKLRLSILATWLIAAVQLMLGVRVREAVEGISNLPRNEWIDGAGNSFLIHRSFAWVTSAAVVFLLVILRKNGIFNSLSKGLLICLGISLLSGIVLGYFSMPWMMQPLHLVVGSVLFGILLTLFWSNHKTTNPNADLCV